MSARVKTARQPLPKHLPRDERIYESDETVCVQCGGGFKHLGDDVSEQLEIIGAAFKVLRHVRRKRACVCRDRIVQGTAPSRPIERGIAGSGPLAQIIMAKFADHQPLYRQAEVYARQGVEVDRSTTARWGGARDALVRPLADALQRYVLAPGKVHTDDTTMPVLAPGNGQTKTARMRVYVCDCAPRLPICCHGIWLINCKPSQCSCTVPAGHQRLHRCFLQLQAHQFSIGQSAAHRL